MSSKARRAANRRNAQRSTGPKTPQGKAASARNAIRHGLSSRTVNVLPNEDPAELEKLAATLKAEHKPTTGSENFLVDQMIHARWKLARIHRLEAEAFDRMLASPDGDPNLDRRILETLEQPGNILDKLQRYAAAAERSYSKALKDLLTLRRQTAKTTQQNKAKDAEIWLETELAKIQSRGLDPNLYPMQNEPIHTPRL